MTFDSITFWVFFALAWSAWRFLPFAHAKSAALLASLVFYGWWNPLYLTLIFASAFVDFFVGGTLAREERVGRRRALLGVSLVVNLGLLAVFKYTPFAWSIAADLSGSELDPARFADWVVPVGISFYTFQTLSYTIDIYRGRVLPARSLRDFLLYVSFFPQLVAGPIVRASQFLPQLTRRRRLTLPRVQLGLYRCIQGLFLKIVVADGLAPMVGRVFEGDVAALDPSAAWLGVVGFGVQIFADFAGYSGIAIGLACLLGLRFPENFRYPYIARSLSEFWTRWHITLSQWLRDYLYIPLGGNRQGRRRTYVNLMVAMLLGGLWHGAAWNFVVWGGLHGAGLAVARSLGWDTRVPSSSGRGRLLRGAGAMALVFVFVHVAWVFFRARDLGTAFTLLERMFVAPLSGEGFSTPLEWRFVVLLLPVAVMHLAQLAHEHLGLRKRAVLRAAVAGFMAACVLLFRRGESQDFIYFQF